MFVSEVEMYKKMFGIMWICEYVLKMFLKEMEHI